MREVVVMADAHYAAHWDCLASFFDAHPQALNPNELLRDFVRACTQNRPSLPVICLGDAIDYVDAEYDAEAGGANNRQRFYREIEPIASDFHEVPGNHDHRQGAYNLRAWGLGQLNIDHSTFVRHSALIGHVSLRSPLRELRALLSLQPPLDGFRGVRRPTYRQIGGLDCVLVNTHGDGYFAPGELLRILAAVAADRWRGRAPHTGIKVRGPSASDLGEIAAALRQCRPAPILLCMHAPLLNPAPKATPAEAQLDPGRLTYELRRHRLDHHVMAGGGALLRLLAGEARAAGRNIVVLAGHAHAAHYFLIHADTLLARPVERAEFNACWHDRQFIKHATVLPLGVIDPHALLPRTGYARVGENGISEVVTRRFPRTGGRATQPVAEGTVA